MLTSKKDTNYHQIVFIFLKKMTNDRIQSKL